MAYTIDERGLERQRLLGKVFDPLTETFLRDELPLSAGMRCLDLGCGIGDTTRLLATHVGQTGELVGLDADPNLIEAARQLTPAADTYITFVQGDASALDFENHRFDFVYTRLLLLHLPSPEQALSEMIRVTKPGGIVAVNDCDFTTLYVHPDSFVNERVPHLFCSLFQDGRMGRKLWSLFNRLGYPSAHVSMTHVLETHGGEGKKTMRMTVEALKEACLAKGVMPEEEFNRLCEELRRVEADPHTIFALPDFYSAWVAR